MNSTLAKTLLTIAAGAVGALCFVPQLASYAPALTAFSGTLLGAAHIADPTSRAEIERLKAALEKYEGKR